MIQKLYIKNKIDILDFINNTNDIYEDFYITINKERKFLKDINLIHKLLQTQQLYGLYQGSLQAVLIIVREKGFRTYIKILAKNNKYYYDFIRFIYWNFFDKEFFVKLKIKNPLTYILKKKGFNVVGYRGQEILLLKYAIKNIKKIIPKDIGEK